VRTVAAPAYTRNIASPRGCAGSVTGPPAAEPDYLKRRRRRRRLWLAGTAVAVVLVVLTARRPDLEEPCATPTAAPAAEIALLPAGLSLDGVGTVTDVREEDPYILVEAVTTTPVDEVTVLIQDAVVAAGYRSSGMDSEGGFEAEVFFTLGGYAGGQARVQQSACLGRSEIDAALLDLDAIPPADADR
jgi:hypothetical protein